MTEWVDFAEVRERVSMEMVLYTFYGLEHLKRQVNKVVGPCPVHGGDSPRAFHADLDKNVWHCFSQCKDGGNQLDLVAKKEGISIREAALRLKARFMVSGDDQRAVRSPEKRRRPAPTGNGSPERSHETPSPAATTRPSQATKPKKNPVLNIQLRLKAEHPHLVKERELQLATIERFGIGYCSRGIMRGTIAIPIENATGELVAYAGRRLRPSDVKEKGKYVFPKGFGKELELYNFHRAVASTANTGLVLVEGFFSVMKLYEAGLDHGVAAMGSSLSVQQAELIATAPEVIIMFDGDPAGRLGATQAAELLRDRTVVRLVELPEGFEPEDLSPRALRWLIRGMTQLDLKHLSLVPPT